MAVHSIQPATGTVHGHFSRELAPVLTVESGDTVVFQTLDSGWGTFEQPDPYAQPVMFEPKPEGASVRHALCGPVAVRGAEPGMVLEVRINDLTPGAWGWSSAGGFPSPLNKRLGVLDGPACVWRWALNPEEGIAKNQHGRTLSMRPFMGVMGMPPNEPGTHSTMPPRSSGGNLDCREIVAGSRLYLPIPVRDGLFSVGDGHALQGDGEISGLALECPMERVELEFILRDDLQLLMPRAHTPAGWITFGLHKQLSEATAIAIEGMLRLMRELGMSDRKEALNLASLVVDLRITQVVNGVRGVHAILPEGALDV
ncbi:MAG: acetamidase/formamidase family protein [Gemmatimonadetes bacterium]|nr:acetamidase/formamidase family protein [Gemmatimonadota bacterium]